MNCCSNPQVKDLSQGLGEHRHLYCTSCKSHAWKGTMYTRQQWDDWVNDVPMPQKPAKL